MNPELIKSPRFVTNTAGNLSWGSSLIKKKIYRIWKENSILLFVTK